jgi:preprotein translocase subunit Sss1
MSKIKKSSKESSKVKNVPFHDYWEKFNYILFIAGIGILIVGYVFMAQGPWDSFISLSISPIVLLSGYIIVIPLAILLNKRKKEKDVPR